MRSVLVLVGIMLISGCTANTTTTTTLEKSYSQDLLDSYVVYRTSISDRDLETFKTSLSTQNLGLMIAAVDGTLDEESFESIASFGDLTLPAINEMTILSETRNENNATWQAISSVKRGYIVFVFEDNDWKIHDEVWNSIR